ncbi:hypothetical protein [Gracilibacillus sp. YIM 98692]|uniref:hypothetical protein n=1 Tax=Gracilibacillus sp. YIM 98692 TaxID=2663532 RepID=UPI0013D7E399|nr:hypothetical protein [Gracilibacillus sp. YIM 98692]
MARHEQAKETIENILEQHEYQIYYEDHRSFLKKVWDKLTTWVGDWLKEWFASFEPDSTASNVIVSLIIFTLLVSIIVGAFLIINKMIQNKRLGKRKPFRTQDIEWQYHEHLYEVERQEKNENYPLATRHLFLALLLLLHDKGWLEKKNWKTNWDYDKELRQSDHYLADKFYQTALYFEQITYGEQAAYLEEYQVYKTKVLQWIKQLEPDRKQKEAGE